MAASTVQSRSMVSNSAWNYAGAAFLIGVTFVTIPIYLKALGLERYGVLAVLTAILAPISVLNLGVTQATVKFVASYTAENQMDAARESIAASLVINFGIGIVGAACCFVGAHYFANFGFKISPELQGEAQVSLRLIGVQWFVALMGGNFRGVIEGLRDQRRVFWGDAINTLLTAVLCTGLALLTHQLTWFLAGQLLAGLIMVLFWWRQASAAMQGLALHWKAARQRFRQVYGYSTWQTLNGLVAVLASVGDRYFIGIFLSAITLGSYNVALRVQAIARTLFYSVNQALFPAASAATSQAGASERLVVTATWHVALLAGMGLGWVSVCGPAFLELWVGPEIAQNTGFALRVLVVTLLFEIPSATGSSYLNAHSLTRLSAFNNIATTVLTLGLMFPLGVYFGVSGVAASGLLGLVLTRAPFHYWMYGKYFAAHVTRGMYLRAFYGVGFCCLGATLLICPIFDFVFGRMSGIFGFLVATLACLPLLVAAVLIGVFYVLREKNRLQEFCAAVAAREIRFLSPSLARFAKNGVPT